MADRAEPTGRRTAFQGSVIRLDVEEWPDQPPYEVVHHLGAAAVLPLLPSNEVLLVKQFRPPVRQTLTEIPAGLLDVEGEDALTCAGRELYEETGYRHREIEFLGGYYASAGFTDEYVHLFWARTEPEPEGDVEDGIEVIRMPFSQMVEAARAGKVRDAKTALALLLAAGATIATVNVPETRYASSDGVNIAYQVVGSGPFDLVYVPGWVSNIEVMWEEPRLAAFLERLASFSRLILFDKRGTGLSDAVPDDHLPTLERRMDDVRAVMDAAGSERAALLGHSEGGNMCIVFSASFPERTSALVLLGSYAKRSRSDDYPWAPDPVDREREIQEAERTWGQVDFAPTLAPSLAEDAAFRGWFKRYLRLSASPRAAASLVRMNTTIDTRAVLPAIRVPTLCIYRTDDPDVKVEEGRYIAEQIPGARFVELPGADHLMWAGDPSAILDEVEGFLTGVRRGPEPDRVLTTVLFTDIVGSTERAADLGDRAWSELVGRHHAAIRQELDRSRGVEVDTAGDGFLAMFDGPARAVRCAVAARDAVAELGLEIRAGVHTGEVERAGTGIRGLAVHIGARIAGSATAGEVLVSRTVKDLVAGSGIEFEDRGEHALKGVPEPWQIFAVERI